VWFSGDSKKSDVSRNLTSRNSWTPPTEGLCTMARGDYSTGRQWTCGVPLEEKKNKSTSESAKIEKQNINIVDNAITELICVDVENEQNSRDGSTFWLAKMCTKYSDTSYIECIIQEKISDLLKKPNLASHWCPRRFNKNDHYFMVLIDYTIKTENTLNGNKQGS